MDAISIDQNTDAETATSGLINNAAFLKNVEITSVVILVLFTVAVALTMTLDVMQSVLIGGAIVLLNFRGVIYVARRIERGATKNKALWVGLFFLKFQLVVLAVFLILRYMQLSLLGFLLGISAVPLALIFQSQRLIMGTKG